MIERTVATMWRMVTMLKSILAKVADSRWVGEASRELGMFFAGSTVRPSVEIEGC
jgi:hypothetical protein